MKNNFRVTSLLLSVVLVMAAVPDQAFAETHTAVSYDKFFRTELYFGMNRRSGGEVTADEWAKFLNDEVTSRFPDGLTVIDAAGQFRLSSGAIVREKSRVIILLYAKKDRDAASRKIDEIRAAYCRSFDQESVMRLDLRRSVEVTF